MSICTRVRCDSLLDARKPSHVRTIVTLLAVVIAVLQFVGGTAEAHGGGPGLGYDPCMRRVGVDDFVHMAVYQPEFNPFAEYCGALPQAGRVLLVFDLIGSELPDSPIGLDVLQDDGRLKVSLPAQHHHSGVANLPADLPAGTYTVRVNIEEPDGLRRVTFPLAVGAWWDRLIVPLLAVLLIIVLTAAYCAIQIKGQAVERNGSLSKNPVELLRRRG